MLNEFKTPKRLNLGCGAFKKDGYINIDLRPVHEPDVLHDLNRFPYPFADDEFELIEADHVLEHLNDPFRVVKELHRISKDGAVIMIRVPHFTRGFTHSGHKRGFDVSFPYYFNPSFKAGYQDVELKLKKMKLSWFAQPHLKRNVMSRFSFSLAYLFGSILSFLANSSPFLCSRFWCFWVGGFEEIEFHFVVRK
jgi:SAM-dependent methyltransferase